MSEPCTSAPMPRFAFHDANGNFTSCELLQAYILPRKVKGALFTGRRRSAGGIGEVSAGALECNVLSASMVAFLGRKERLEAWLRESGAGCSCMWAPVEDLIFDSRKKVFHGQLKLSYRLRTEEVFCLPILKGTLFELSTQENSSKRINERSVPEILQQGDSDLSETWRDNLSTCSRNSSSQEITGKSETSGKAVHLLLNEKAYGQLLRMVSLGGVIRDYQSLLSQCIGNSCFLDAEFQLVDLREWLKIHAFALFWKDMDVVVVKMDTAGYVKWTLLRFDFEAGVIMSTVGTCLCILEIIFANSGVSHNLSSRKSWWGNNEPWSFSCKDTEKRLEEVQKEMEWILWDSPCEVQERKFVSPLTRILTDLLGSSTSLIAAEVGSSELGLRSETYQTPPNGLHEDPQNLTFQTFCSSFGRKGWCAKEKLAFANLHSDSKYLRLEGIETLSEILLKSGGPFMSGGRANPLHSQSTTSNPNTSRSSSLVWPQSDQDDTEISFPESLRKENQHRETIEQNGTHEGRTSDSDTYEGCKDRQGASLTCAIPKGNHKVVCVDSTSRVVSGADQDVQTTPVGSVVCNLRSEVECKIGITQVFEWVKAGFLEALMESLLTPPQELRRQNWKYVTSNFDAQLELCLKVTELLPREGIHRMVNLIITNLQEISNSVGKFTSTNDRRQEEDSQKEYPSDSSELLMQRRVPSPTLEETFARALRFFKFFFAAVTRLPFFVGALATAGGLNRILKFYFCLLKKFPLNLRLGAKTLAKEFSTEKEDVLPGEVLESQTGPVKILPCIFPSWCICRSAQPCLLESCRYPLQEVVNLSMLTRESCNLKEFMTRSGTGLGVSVLANESNHNCVEQLLLENPLSSNGERNSKNSQKVNGQAAEGHQEAYVIMLPVWKNSNDSFRGCVSDEKNSGISSCSDLPMSEQNRPYVPRLPLRCVQPHSSKMPSGPFGDTRPPGMVHLDSENLAPKIQNSSPFNVLKAVFDIKYEIIRSLVTLFANQSMSFMRIRDDIVEKVKIEEKTHLVLKFLPDMIGGLLNVAPEDTLWRTKRLLLRLVLLLENSGMRQSSSSANVFKICGTGHGCNSSYRIVPGPASVPKDLRRPVHILLVEIGGRLTYLVYQLTKLLSRFVADENSVAVSPCSRMQEDTACCKPSLINRTLHNGHVLSLWVDVGLLIRFLGDFVLLWPEGGASGLLLEFCGKSMKKVYELMSKSFSHSSWNLAQVLAMQHLFKLSTACLNSSAHDKSTDPQAWQTVDNFFYELFLADDQNWSCVKDFADWVLLRSCQGCQRRLLEGYQKVLWEPLKMYYTMMGQDTSPPSNLGKYQDSYHRKDTLRNCVLPFLRATVQMIQRKLLFHSLSSHAFTVSIVDRLVFMLEFVMNPDEGLLMTIIKASSSWWQTNQSQTAFNCSSSRKMKPQPLLRQPKLSGNKEPLCTQGLCRNSPNVFSGIHLQNFTPSMKHECICILTDIFNLKFQESSEELYEKSLTRNPFLLRRYVIPFLEVIFICFLKCYSDKGQFSEGSLLRSSGYQNHSSRQKKSMNCSLLGSEALVSGRESTEDRMVFSSESRDELVTSSVITQEDERASVSCIQYARVLLALAQNQTEDISIHFQQTRVMDFLVQQIGLEYEVSQVATPRETVKEVKGTKCHLLSGNVIAQDSYDREGVSPIPVHGRREDRSCDLDTISEGDSTQKVQSKLQVSPDCMSHLNSDPQQLVSSLNLNRESRLGQSVDFPGLRSPRDVHCCNSAKKQTVSASLDHSPFGFQSREFKWHNCIVGDAIAKELLSFKEWNRNVLAEPALSERGTTSTCTNSQKGRDLAAALNRKFLGGSESFRKPPLRKQRTSLPSVDGKIWANLTTELMKTVNDTSLWDDQSSLETDKGVVDIGSNPVKYSGRFFDLNEEVERELAREELAYQVSTGRDESKSPDVSARSNVFSNSENLPCELKTKLTESNSKRLEQNSVQSSAELASLPSRKLQKPAIPRLKLPKAVRKGGQEVTCDSLADLDLLVSTTSTKESICRLDPLLELQMEFTTSHLERSWRLGSYETERVRRRLYRHAGLHVLLLELYIALMLNSHGTLEASYSDRFPMESRKLNAPFFLSYRILCVLSRYKRADLNHTGNSYLLPCLSKRMKHFKSAAFRILKLTWRALFSPSHYRDRIRIAHGAFAQVYTAVRCQNHGTDIVVLKVIDVPKGPHDPCKFFDVFSEVEILERFVGEPRICQLLDYGVEAESFVLVLKHYKCNLRVWSTRHRTIRNLERKYSTGFQKLFYETLPLYLEVYSAVLQAVKVLEAENVVHYDLKCDNILLDPLCPGSAESGFWTPAWPPLDPSSPLPFRICLADFGQSKGSMHIGGECTVRDRGTEYVRSPEMLKLLSNQSQRKMEPNIRHHDEPVGKSVDVWSLGCLLFELLTGEYLLYDDDWLRFFIRVTSPSEELITEEKAAKVDNYGPVLDLLRFILIRDPIQRPTLDDLTICVEQLQMKVQDQINSRKNQMAGGPYVEENTGDFEAVLDGHAVQTHKFSQAEVYPVKQTKNSNFPDTCFPCLKCLFSSCGCNEDESG